MGVRFETETVLEGYGVAEDEVHGCDFLEEVVDALLALALLDVNPDIAGEVAALDQEGGPGLATFGVTVFSLVLLCAECRCRICYRSYAVELRKERDRPTTKPRTVRSKLDTLTARN